MSAGARDQFGPEEIGKKYLYRDLFEANNHAQGATLAAGQASPDAIVKVLDVNDSAVSWVANWEGGSTSGQSQRYGEIRQGGDIVGVWAFHLPPESARLRPTHLQQDKNAEVARVNRQRTLRKTTPWLLGGGAALVLGGIFIYAGRR